MTDLARQLGLEPRRLAARWGWFVALGVVMVIAGGFALADTVLVTLVSVIFIGAALLIAGIFQVIHAFANKGWVAFLMALLGGALYIVGGLLIMDEPVNGSVVSHPPSCRRAGSQRRLAHSDGVAPSRASRLVADAHRRRHRGCRRGVAVHEPAMVQPVAAWHADRDRADL
jgi:Short repeat of unknown function (DUF308)